MWRRRQKGCENCRPQMTSTEECLSDSRLMHMCTDKDCGSKHRACPGFSPDRVTTMRGGCRHRLPPPTKKLSATDTHQLGKYQFFSSEVSSAISITLPGRLLCQEQAVNTAQIQGHFHRRFALFCFLWTLFVPLVLCWFILISGFFCCFVLFYFVSVCFKESKRI